MFDEIGLNLKHWLTDDVGLSQVDIGAPQQRSDTPCVSLHLLNVLPARPSMATRMPAYEVVLEYLVTAAAATPQEEHALLGRVAFAAMEQREFAARFEARDAGFWQAFGVLPKPAFCIQAPVAVQRSEDLAPPVRVATEVRIGNMLTLYGRVLNDEDRPIVNAVVSIQGRPDRVKTDARGEFALSGVSAQDDTCRLRVSARGVQIEREVAVSGDSLIIQFNPGAQ